MDTKISILFYSKKAQTNSLLLIYLRVTASDAKPARTATEMLH